MAKTTCPISRTEFAEKAKSLDIAINGKSMQAQVKEFSTGSFGWNVNEKTTVEIDGKIVSVQVGINLTVVGSKELPR